MQYDSVHCKYPGTVTVNAITISLDITYLASKAEGSKDWRGRG